MGKIPFFPKNMSVQSQVVAVLSLVLIWSLVYRHFSQMDGRFFQPSLSGIKGLVLYEIGDLRGAALAYRAHLQETDTKERVEAGPAWDALLRKDFETAAWLSKTALEKNPSDINPLLNLGEIALEQGDLEEALRRFDQVLLKKTDQFDALLLSAVIRARRQEFAQSIDLINRALRTSKVETRLTSFLWALRTTGELAQRPGAERPLSTLAHLYRYLRIFDSSNERKAVAYAKQAIAAGDRADDLYLTLGVIASKKRKSDEALAFFLKAIEINPSHAEAHRRAAQIYSDRGDLASEYRMMKKAYLSAPQDSFYAEALSVFLTETMGDYHQALALARHFLEGQPDNVTLLERAGYLSSLIGDREGAIEYYRQGLKVDPGNPGLYEAIGYNLNELKRPDEAFAAYETALSIDPLRSRAYLGLAVLYNNKGAYPEAIEAYETAFELGYRNPKVMTNLCSLYHRSSEFEAAVVCFRRVLSADPRNALAEHLLSYAMANLEPGRTKE